MAAEVICLGGLLGYVVYSNKKMTMEIKTLEARLSRLEKRLTTLALQCPPSQPSIRKQPSPLASHPILQPTQQPSLQVAHVPTPFEEKEEEPLDTDKERELEMDAEITEELEKLVDFVHLKQ